jgi:hypothetical protein
MGAIFLSRYHQKSGSDMNLCGTATDPREDREPLRQENAMPTLLRQEDAMPNLSAVPAVLAFLGASTGLTVANQQLRSVSVRAPRHAPPEKPVAQAPVARTPVTA